MMGTKEKMITGAEIDALTPSKRFYKWRSGVRKAIKRQFNKRIRKNGKQIDNGDTE